MIAVNYIIFILFVLSLIIGIFIFIKPELSIKIQQRFYERINWRIEPISMTKEIRNTKIMGLFLFAVSIFAAIYGVVSMLFNE